ncbi:hypothetical protein HDU67_005672 [Dinochytrium kinnereticum]|nr:hypothetical protein HDU67_005672 [Dinochytrium kinnereticum]
MPAYIVPVSHTFADVPAPVPTSRWGDISTAPFALGMRQSSLLARLESMIEDDCPSTIYHSASAAFGCVRPSAPAPDHPRNAKTIITWKTA